MDAVRLGCGLRPINLPYLILSARTGSSGQPIRRRHGRSPARYTFATLDGEFNLQSLFGANDTLLLIHNIGRYCTLWADGLNLREQGLEEDYDNRPGAVVYERMAGNIVRKNSCVFGPGDLYCPMWNFLALGRRVKGCCNLRNMRKSSMADALFPPGIEAWTPQFSYWRRTRTGVSLPYWCGRRVRLGVLCPILT